MFCYEGRMLPSLFVIGGMKCGTTTLNRDLEALGQSALSCGLKLKHDRCNEKHFLDNDGLVEKYGLLGYSKLFEKCASPSSVFSYPFISMDKTPAYIRVPAVPSHLLSLYSPPMIQMSTFVLVLRDPIARLKSEYGHHKSHGRLKNFDEFYQYVDHLFKVMNKHCPSLVSDALIMKDRFNFNTNANNTNANTTTSNVTTSVTYGFYNQYSYINIS